MASNIKYSSSIIILFISCLFFSSYTHAMLDNQRRVYIVYLGEHKGSKSKQEIQDDHHSLLQSIKSSKEEVLESILYSYKNSINGFAALLTEEEATMLSGKEEVLSTFPSKAHSTHTTRSWEFMIELEKGKENNVSETMLGQDVIIGMLDSGIWLESESFSDKGMGPIPKKWKGKCLGDASFNSSHCNNKIIGANYYMNAYLTNYGPLNLSYAYLSPRDHDGHGTHTASTASGRLVPHIAALGGFAEGTTLGGAPLSRLAIYKVCWPIPGPNPNLENACFDADILAAFDDAIGDGVDVISASIGDNWDPISYSIDGIALGALHATKSGVVVVCSGGNSGPAASTVVNLAPWVVTVAASGTDRGFDSPVMLGNGVAIKGQTVTDYLLESKELYPLVYASDVVVPGTVNNLTGQCLPNSLDANKVKGKIVLCLRGDGSRVGKGMEVKRAGGAAIILGNAVANGDSISVDSHLLPGTAVSSDDAITILNYIKSAAKPSATIGRAQTTFNVRPSPVMADFSSRGPNRIEPNILKPDVTAPGLNILAAWSETSSPTKFEDDKRSVKYNVYSGTSMACPHVSGIAALLKSKYPNWSSAAIRSAIITTATIENTQGGPITNAAGLPAGPMELGSGHIRPIHAMDPGLIYDAAYEDYLLFSCASIGVQMDPYFPCPKNVPSPSNLNHPSITVANLNGSTTITRTVTNVGQEKVDYHVSIIEPTGVKVHISPEVLGFTKLGETKSFLITIKADEGKRLGKGEYVAGSYMWSDGTHSVRSPIVVLFP